MTDRYRGPVEPGHSAPGFSTGQLAFLVAAIAITIGALGALAGVVPALVFALGLTLGLTLGVAA